MAITGSDPGQNYPDDLADVLSHVALDKLATTRPKIANHPHTREFLEVGLQLLREDFIGHVGTERDSIEHCRLFESVSLNRLLERSATNDRYRGQPLQLTPAKFKERWRLKNRYTEDLIAYLFRTAPQMAYMGSVRAAAEIMIRTMSFGDLVRELAAAEVNMVLADPLFGLHAIVEVTLPNHPRVQEFLRAQEQILLPQWAAVYERIATAYGLQLASRYTWLDLAVLLNSMINGVLAQTRSSGGTVPSLSNGDDIMAGAIFAMLPTFLSRPDEDWDRLYAVRQSGLAVALPSPEAEAVPVQPFAQSHAPRQDIPDAM